MTHPALELEQVSRSFGGVQAVSSVSLRVDIGERVAILGPNGAGKTTLFHLISGVTRVSEGRIRLLGQDVTGRRPHVRARLGLSRTFQITEVFHQLSVVENMVLALEAAQGGGWSSWPRRITMHRTTRTAGELLRRWNLHEQSKRRPSELSYGEQRVLELALALCGDPKVLLLDEPTAGLSPSETEMMIEILGELDPSLAMVVIEHDISVAAALSERAMVLHRGAVLMEGRMAEVRSDARVNDVYLGTSDSMNDNRS